MRTLDYILTGTGRCATGFFARYLTSAGIPIGHEKFFGPDGLERATNILANHWVGLVGDSSWLAAPFLNSPSLRDSFIIHLIRHPLQQIGSALKVGARTPLLKHFYEFQRAHLPEMRKYEEDEVTRVAFRYVRWNRMIEEACRERPHLQFKIEQDPWTLIEELASCGLIDLSGIEQENLFSNQKYNTKFKVEHPPFGLRDIARDVRQELIEISQEYGYEWPTSRIYASPKSVIKAIITGLDNLDTIQQSVDVLRGEPISEIIVVNNGSIDGTKDWLNEQADITSVHRENKGAGPGRNSGLDAAGTCDYLLLLDAGIRPLRLGTQRMLDFLNQRPDVDVIGVEISDFQTDEVTAWRRWVEPIVATYQNTRLSHTAYCLARYRAFEKIRFSEEGPFGEPGWGVDDDEMAYQWIEAGIVVHVVTGVHPYRHASGSFRRLHRETGIWPTQYGSVYEKRLVWCQQNWPQHQPGNQWGEPWLTVVVQVTSVEKTAKIIKTAHQELKKRRFEEEWGHIPNPYSIVAWGDNREWLEWAKPRHLCRDRGDTVVNNGSIEKRTPENEGAWTGNFRIWERADWEQSIRPQAYYYGLVQNLEELKSLLRLYADLHPPQPSRLNHPNMRKKLWPITM